MGFLLCLKQLTSNPQEPRSGDRFAFSPCAAWVSRPLRQTFQIWSSNPYL